VRVGEAKATTAGLLPARWVIHAVGPVWQGGGHGERSELAAAHRSSLAVATQLGARSVAFPAISCGVYGFPVDEAARIAIETVRLHELELVRFVLFGDDAYRAYASALAAT